MSFNDNLVSSQSYANAEKGVIARNGSSGENDASIGSDVIAESGTSGWNDFRWIF